MGYIKHKAITVTSWDSEKLEKVHTKAKSVCGDRVSEIIKSPVNGYISFIVCPDGSKEGWDSSEQGDKEDSELVDFINEQAYEDGSNSISYIHYFYGEDNRNAGIINHN